MAVKSSILVFYLTLTRGENFLRWANYVTLFITNLAGLVLTLVFVFQCRPVGSAFLSTLPPGATCTDIVTLYLSSAPVNIATDLAILFLPIPIITKMHLPRKQKIILIITFGFGFFAIAVDVVRIAFLQQAATSHQMRIETIHLSMYQNIDFSCMAFCIFFLILSLPRLGIFIANQTCLIFDRVCVTIFHVVRR